MRKLVRERENDAYLARQILPFFIAAKEIEIVGSEVDYVMQEFDDFCIRTGKEPLNHIAVGRAIAQMFDVTRKSKWTKGGAKQVYAKKE